MIPGRPEGADTKLVGQDVSDLHVRTDYMEDGKPCLLSVWEPTPEEVEAIRQGAKVHLWVIGLTLPPVCLEVGDIPPMLEPVKTHAGAGPYQEAPDIVELGVVVRRLCPNIKDGGACFCTGACKVPIPVEQELDALKRRIMELEG